MESASIDPLSKSKNHRTGVEFFSVVPSFKKQFDPGTFELKPYGEVRILFPYSVITYFVPDQITSYR